MGERRGRTRGSFGSGRCGWSPRSGRSRVGVGGDDARSRSCSGSGRRRRCGKWVRQAEVDAGERPGTTTEESAELKRLKRENAELKRANAILKAASAFFAAELDRPQSLIVGFIREHADRRQRG